MLIILIADKLTCFAKVNALPVEVLDKSLLLNPIKFKHVEFAFNILKS